MMKYDVFSILSDEALLNKVEELTRRERRMTFNVVMHLGEVERRGLHLRAGYGSMYDYCMGRLGYSESSTYRRLATARCIRKFPEVGKLVRENKLTIVTAPKVASVLNEENKDALLKAVLGKSQAEVDRIVAGYKTGKPIRDRIKPIVVERPVMPLAMETPDMKAPSATLGEISHHCEAKNNPTVDCAQAGRVPQPQLETYYEVTIAADEEFMHLYHKVCAMHSTKANPGQDMAATFKAVMREYVKRNDPKEKSKRRSARIEKKSTQTKREPTQDDAPAIAPQPNSNKLRRETNKRPPPEKRSRYIAATIRDDVSIRDGDQCTYVGTDGVRCRETRYLQIDHVVPFARGGQHTMSNLRLLCSAHNRLEAKTVFGSAVPGVVREAQASYFGAEEEGVKSRHTSLDRRGTNNPIRADQLRPM